MYTEYDNSVDNLIADVKPAIITQGIKLKMDTGVYIRGTVLGKITASGLCVVVDTANADGSEVSYCILPDDVDTTGATSDVTTAGFFSGSFQENNLIFGGADDADTHREALRDKNIYLK